MTSMFASNLLTFYPRETENQEKYADKDVDYTQM